MLNVTERLEVKEQALHEVNRTKKYISGARKFLGEGKIGLAIERYDIAEDALESANYYRELYGNFQMTIQLKKNLKRFV